MKKYMMMVGIMLATIATTQAQYGYPANGYNDDRYYCDDNFDWHWDIRVRISNGASQGLLTPNETNRLYRRLEDIERREYAFQSDGFFSSWEQQEIWNEVVYLNRQVGLELYDYDRTFYGFDPYGYDRRGYASWYYKGGYDFYRFDKRGFGTIRLGYAPRPNYIGWFRHNNNRTARDYYSKRNNDYGRNDGRYRNDVPGSRGGYDNRPNAYPGQAGGYPQGGYDHRSSGGYDNRPNTYPNQGGGRSQGGNDNRSNGGNDNRPNTNPIPGGSRPQGGYDTRPNPNGGYENGRNSQGNSNEGRRHDPANNERGDRHRRGEW